MDTHHLAMSSRDIQVSKTARSIRLILLFVFVGLILLAAYRQGLFTPSTRVYLVLPGASGLDVGAPVRLRGFQVGEVESIQLQDDLTVRAILRVESARLPLLSIDTTARMARDTPVASKHIDLYPNPTQPVRLAQGHFLTYEEGQEIDDLLATVKQTLDQLNGTLSKVGPILENVNTMATSLATGLPEIQRSGRQIALSVQNTATNVEGTSKVVRAFASDLESSRGVLLEQVGTILQNARQSSDSLNLLIRDIQGKVPPALESGQRLLIDAQDMSDSLKQRWPFSSLLNNPAGTSTTLDSFEGSTP